LLIPALTLENCGICWIMLLFYINSYCYLFINLLVKLISYHFFFGWRWAVFPAYFWDWPMISIFSWLSYKMFLCGWMAKIPHFVLSSQLLWCHGVTVLLFYIIASCRMMINWTTLFYDIIQYHDNFSRKVWGWTDMLKIIKRKY